MGLLEVAEGGRAGSTEEEKRLKRAIVRWVGDDERIMTLMTFMRTKMLGKMALGSDMYEHIMVYFVKPMVGDGSDAEKAFLQVDYETMYGETEELMHAAVDESMGIIDHLLTKGQGEPAD